MRIGTELAGYRLEALLGRGGMGVVYRAHDLALDRNVALKLLAPELAEDARFRERFLTESRLAASLDHPNVVPIYDAGEVDGQLYIAMRYVEGSDLKQLLREGPLEPARASRSLAQVAGALDAAHARGLVHRDVKPSNVLLDERGARLPGRLRPHPGASASRRPRSARRSRSARSTTSPRSRSAGEEVDGRADVYSLGCLLYECLTGEPPFARGTDAAVLFAHLEEEPPGAARARGGAAQSAGEGARRALPDRARARRRRPRRRSGSPSRRRSRWPLAVGRGRARADRRGAARLLPHPRRRRRRPDARAGACSGSTLPRTASRPPSPWATVRPPSPWEAGVSGSPHTATARSGRSTRGRAARPGSPPSAGPSP